MNLSSASDLLNSNIFCQNNDVLALNNKTSNLINENLSNISVTEEGTYLSSDTTKYQEVNQMDEDLKLEYQTEYLNSFNFLEFFLHK